MRSLAAAVALLSAGALTVLAQAPAHDWLVGATGVAGTGSLREGQEPLVLAAAEADDVGEHRLSGFAEGRYVLTADPAAPIEERQTRVRGRMTIEGNAMASLGRALYLSAPHVDPDRVPTFDSPIAIAKIRDDLTFEVSGLNGPRVFRPMQAPPGWGLRAVWLNGVDVTDTPLPFGRDDQSIDDLETLLTDRVRYRLDPRRTLGRVPRQSIAKQ